MAAVVASKVKRQRQLAEQQKNADGTPVPGPESQLIQRRAASASREAAERRKLSQYYSQVEGDFLFLNPRKTFLILKKMAQYSKIISCDVIISFYNNDYITWFLFCFH